MAQRMVDVEEVESLQDPGARGPSLPYSPSEDMDRYMQSLDLDGNEGGGHGSASIGEPMAYLTEQEEQMLWSFSSEDFYPEEEIPSIKRRLKRLLNMRQTHWTVNPPGVNAIFQTDDPTEPIKVLLVGVGGVGKSRLGTVLDGGAVPVFKSSDSVEAETMKVKRTDFEFEGQKIALFDTPGYVLKDLIEHRASYAKMTAAHQAIQKGLNEIGDGVNVIIFVISAGNGRTYDTEIKIMKEAMLLNQRTFDHCMMVVTHCKSKYESQGRAKLLQNIKKTGTIIQFLQAINERVVLVELGTKLESYTSDASLETYTYECERKQVRKMVVAMLAKVVEDNRSAGRSVLYPRTSMESDLRRRVPQTNGQPSTGNGANTNRQGARTSRNGSNANPGTGGGPNRSAGSSSGSSCFPSIATVDTPNGKKTMKDLQLNDLVLVVNQKGQLQYKPIIMSSHSDPDALSDFVSLTTEQGNIIQQSPGHLIHVGELGNLKAAQDVKVGEVVFTVSNGEAMGLHMEKVKAIRSEQLLGLHCPNPFSQTIIVNGFVTSCYTNAQPPMLAHAGLFPVMVLHRVLPTEWFTWLFSYDNTQTVLTVIRSVVKAANSLLR